MTEPAPIAVETSASENPPQNDPGARPSHPLTRPRVLGPLVALVALINLPFVHLFWLRGEPDATVTLPFEDGFDRTAKDPGPDYVAVTGGDWRLADGWLWSPGVHNNPLWLKAALPGEVVVEFDARAEGGSGDIKCEIFGNGRDHASGYVLVFGGWNNTISTIARLDEHGRDRKERRDKTVEKGRTYHFRISRQGGRLDWSIDGEPFLSFDDPAPLKGRGHDRFAFSSWANDIYFDHLSVRSP